MNDVRPQIAIKLRLAAHLHSQAFPHGDWRGANDQLGALRRVATALHPETLGMGNEICAQYLCAEFAA